MRFYRLLIGAGRKLRYYLYGQLSYFLTLHKETIGFLKFPGYPFEYMPWSKTPVVS
jgi:hypothetical protein